MVASPGEIGLYSKSTIVPDTLFIIKKEEEDAKEDPKIIIAKSPGARKTINGTPSMSSLSFPIATDRIRRSIIEPQIGDKIVWMKTFSICWVIFIHKVTAPIQFTNPNLFTPILYFLLISTIRSLITSKNKISVKNFFFKQILDFFILTPPDNVIRLNIKTRYRFNRIWRGTIKR